MKNLAKCVDTCGIDKSHKCGLVNKSKDRVICSEQSQDIYSVLHEKRFSVLGDKNDECKNVTDCNTSILVEVSDESECYAHVPPKD